MDLSVAAKLAGYWDDETAAELASDRVADWAGRKASYLAVRLVK
jgi:hypothetical protein